MAGEAGAGTSACPAGDVSRSAADGCWSTGTMSANVSQSVQPLTEAPTALSVRRAARGNGRAGRQGGSYENKGEVALPGRPNGARTSLA